MKLIIGLGTGRNGSKSLATLLSLQPGVEAYHEFGRLPWIQNRNRFNQIMDAFMEYEGTEILADIGNWYIQYVDDIIERFGKNVRFVCLERDDHEVVRSYLQKVTTSNHWTKDNSKARTGNEKASPFDECYPKYDAPKREAILEYCKDYRELNAAAEKRFPQQFKIFGLNVFKEVKLQEEMLLFAGIPKNQIHTCLNIVENKGQSLRTFIRRVGIM